MGEEVAYFPSSTVANITYNSRLTSIPPYHAVLELLNIYPAPKHVEKADRLKTFFRSSHILKALSTFYL